MLRKLPGAVVLGAIFLGRGAIQKLRGFSLHPNRVTTKGPAVALSYRDPGGLLTVEAEGVFRQIFENALALWDAFARSAILERHRFGSQIVGTEVLSVWDRIIISA